MPRLIDLSHEIGHGTVTYKGLPAPIICDFLSREASRDIYEAGTEFHIGKIEMVANSGTYVDSPFHRYADGKDLAELPLESLVDLPGIVVDATRAGTSLNKHVFESCELEGRAVLVRTDWSRHWGTDQYFESHPFLTEDAAVFLRNAGVKIVGIDSYNIDDVSGRTRPVHSTLLAADIPIVEHMTNLSAVPASAAFRFHAAPVKVRRFGTFPVRCYAVVEEFKAE